MSFWDNVKKIAQPYGDDDYDDYDDEEYVDDYEEETTRRAPRRSAPVSSPVMEEEELEETDFGFNLTPSTPAATPAAPAGFSGRVVTMNSTKQEVILFRPVNFNETSKAADDLRAGKAVVLNMENVDKAMARRVVDFLTGCVYAVDGTVKKIAQSAYMFCPHNMEMIGDLESLKAEIDGYV